MSNTALTNPLIIRVFLFVTHISKVVIINVMKASNIKSPRIPDTSLVGRELQYSKPRDCRCLNRHVLLEDDDHRFVFSFVIQSLYRKGVVCDDSLAKECRWIGD